MNTQESSGNIGMNPTNLNQNSPLSKFMKMKQQDLLNLQKKCKKSKQIEKPAAPIRNPKQQAMQNKKCWLI